MAVFEKVLLFRRVFGKQEDFGARSLGRSDDIFYFATRVMRQF